MAFIDTKAKFHVALDGNGLILQGAPDRLAYSMTQAPVYGNRFAQGDRSINDFAFWWYWSQTDWAGGIKEEGVWADDAQFETSENIDAVSVGGQFSILVKPTAQTTTLTNTDKVNIGTFGNVGNSAASEVKFYVGTRATTIDGSNGAKVWSSSNGDTWTQLMHFVNVDTCRDLFFGNDASNNRYIFAIFNKGAQKYDGSTVTDISANAGANFFSCGVGHLGAAFVISGLTSSFPSMLKSTDAFATAGSSFLTFQHGEEVRHAASFNGSIYYLLERGGGITELRSVDGVDATTDALIYSFTGLTPFSDPDRYNTSLRVVGSHLMVIFEDGSVWSVSTANAVSRVYKDVNGYMSNYNSIVRNDKLLIGNIVVQNNNGDFAVFNDRRNADDTGYMLPIATNGTTTLYRSSSGNTDTIYRDAAGSYYNTGTLDTSEFAIVSGVDKLFNSVIITFDALTTGQEIKVEYSADGGSFTEVGGSGNGSVTFAIDGAATSKIFKFGDNIVARKMVLRITLTAGASDTTTPKLLDFSTQYIPIPFYSKQWSLNINCADEVKRLDGRLVETTARELKGTLERSWWTKSILDFQDLDYATTLIDGALSAIAEGGALTGLTITVDNADDFPEQGRLRIDDEEILYTGKTRTTFTGCTRGARGTKALAHSDNAVINNAYKVLLTDLQYRIPVALEDKDLEYVIGISLREV